MVKLAWPRVLLQWSWVGAGSRGLEGISEEGMRGDCVMPRPVRWDVEGLRLRKEPMLGREERGGDG